MDHNILLMNMVLYLNREPFILGNIYAYYPFFIQIRIKSRNNDKNLINYEPNPIYYNNS